MEFVFFARIKVRPSRNVTVPFDNPCAGLSRYCSGWLVAVFSLVACLPSTAPRAATVTFSGSTLSLSISDASGQLITESDASTVLTQIAADHPPILLTVGGVASRYPIMLRPRGDDGLQNFLTIGRHWRRVGQMSTTDTGDATVLRVESREGDWYLTVDYRIPRNATRIERRFSIRYEGIGVAILRGIAVTMPTLLAAPDDLLELPGSPVPPSLRVGDIGSYALRVSGVGPGLLAVRRSKFRGALLCWAYSETETPHMQVTKEDHGLTPSYTVELAARLAHGQEVSWGTDYLWALKAEDWSASLSRFQRWWNTIGVQTPRDRPRWTESALLYEAQIGAAPFDRGAYQFNPYPTVQALIDKLDYIHALGFNTIELMPHHPSPGYAVDDYLNPSRQYGAGFERLVGECHKRGMRIIVDWVVHGVIDQEVARKTLATVNSGSGSYRKTWLPNYVLNQASYWLEDTPAINPLRANHPNWFMKNEDGSPASIYTWAFDLQNADLQSYIIDAMRFYVRRLKVDGFRVDAPEWNAFPNWDATAQYRASYSETGSIRLFDRARSELHRLNSDIMLYTEPSSPTFRRMFDVNYSYGEFWLYGYLLAWHRSRKAPDSLFPRSPGIKTVSALGARTWFRDLRASNPAGALTIHQVDSHDSFWWPPPGLKFRREQFGPEGYRALFFTMAMLDGGLMQYATAEEGNEDFVRKVLTLRTRTAEIVDGHCLYLLPKVSSDAVFAVGWESKSGWALPMTNFSGVATKVRIQLRDTKFGWEPSGRYEVKELLNNLPLNGLAKMIAKGSQLDELDVELQPLQSALIVVRKM